MVADYVINYDKNYGDVSFNIDGSFVDDGDFKTSQLRIQCGITTA